MARGGSIDESAGLPQIRVGEAWKLAADLVRAHAKADGGAQPVFRKIRGQTWIAFHEVVLDEVADDLDWYGRAGLNRPLFVMGSGAICAEEGREDEALVRLAANLSPFDRLLAEEQVLSRAA